MLLAVGPFAGFTGLLQILLWIVTSFLIVAFLVTVFMHYRRKKKVLEPDDVYKLVESTPESAGFKIDDQSYVLFDHSGLIREYKTRLVNNHARYTALKHDFEKLEDKYHSLVLQESTANETLKITNMEQSNPLLENMNQRLQEMEQQLENERADWLKRTEELKIAVERMEKENGLLQENLRLASAGEEEKLQLIGKWKEENNLLRTKLSEQEFLRDIIEEKKMEIGFLQQQLEQRIRNFHVSEQQLTEAKDQLQQTRFQLENIESVGQTNRLELDRKQEAIDSLQNLLNEKISLVTEAEQTLAAKIDHITYLENSFLEIKDQNEMLQASIADHVEKSNNMMQQLDDERSRSAMMEQKLLANKQLLLRLYREFSACMEEESPVVSLHPSYISKANSEEWDESAAQ